MCIQKPLNLALHLIVLTSLLAVNGRGQQGTVAGFKVEPENIQFVGNRLFSVSELRAIFRSAGTVTAQLPQEALDTYNDDRINHAIKVLLTFYRNRGFVKASISPPEVAFGPEETHSRISLIFKVTENNAYELKPVQLVGTTVLRENVALSVLNLQPGAKVNLSKINAGILALRETYLTLGYLDVDIKSSLDAPDGKKSAQLKIVVTEGSQYHLANIDFAGHSLVPEELFREMLPLQKGDIFGHKAFDACLETINELGITPVLTGQDVDFQFDKTKALVGVTIHLQGKAAKHQ